ncbi:MAG TPA: hypothetical protein VF773_10335 [Verrucomicrobiae bacterium]
MIQPDGEGIGAAAAGLKAGDFPAAAEVFGEVFLDEAVLVAEGADERLSCGVGGVIEIDGDEFLFGDYGWDGWSRHMKINSWWKSR